jgi:farnesyl diphosphate synthase
MLDYNVPGGKLNRGMAVYDVLAAMKGPEVGADLQASRGSALGREQLGRACC